jgi:hypothetical protein
MLGIDNVAYVGYIRDMKQDDVFTIPQTGTTQYVIWQVLQASYHVRDILLDGVSTHFVGYWSAAELAGATIVGRFVEHEGVEPIEVTA